MCTRSPLIPALLCTLAFGLQARAAVPQEHGTPSMRAEAPATAASTAREESDDPEVQFMLRAMDRSSTQGHPDLFGRFTGMHCFATQDYACALKYFKFGAYYADKFSELALGLMYSNGNGVRKDPVKAWAWLALSASRGYPGFVATRERIGAKLTTAQRKAAESELKVLDKTYGDKVAMPRMLGAMRLALSQMTGSHTGFDSGVTTYSPEVGPQLTPRGFGGLRDRWYWDPKDYFVQRDAQWGSGTVAVGALQQVREPAPASASSSH